MARPQRIEFSGACYLVTTLAADAGQAFCGDADREDFLDVLSQVVTRNRWRCHAYCLGTQGYELVVQTREPNLSRGMRQLNGVYTQRFNERNGRTGQIFGGRFKAVLIERARWLGPTVASVLARRGETARGRAADRWQISSYAATLGGAGAPAWLDVAGTLAAFGPSAAQARKALQHLIGRRDVVSQVRESVRGQIFLGSDRFIARVQSGRAGKPARRRPATAIGALLRAARGDPKAAMARAYLSGGYNMGEIARHFGVHYSTVSRAVRAFERSRTPGRD